ncbi:uncharacterized protein I303_101923 [Kwoniella dejecticola CBS 10117]|uniref:Uncharacterized protein n=1 Tax=Kwoniella dejecticola CBS 10117 TaxID=1296121 RepID=A0A1A6ACE6_9TREE|nr:uncharacterized protein I303_01941 [Kwoniella dejecticola CBS 10117]OBR87729.1 hypothetical protein I303_01941 [Kwoniella dejecticola CBS 10117]
MSRSHVANMHSISSLPSVNYELSTPRSAPSPAYGNSNSNGACTPPLVPRGSSDRDRPRDSGVQAIGAFFSAPYDSDLESDTDEPIPTPQSQARTPIARARSARAVSVSVKTAKAYKDALEAKIKSQTGELDHWDNTHEYNQDGGLGHDYYGDEDRMEDLEPPRSPAKRDISSRQSDESGRVRPLTVVEFPEPTLQPTQGHGKGYPSPSPSSSPSSKPTPPYNPRPNAPPPSHSDDGHHHTSTEGYPRTPFRTNTSPGGLQPTHSSHDGHFQGRPQPRIDTSSLSPPRTILLPPPASPISPMLAAPPQPHFSPLSLPSSPFAKSSALGHGHGKTDSMNGSIRGFDIMAEKKALFREGQEELMSPFSTRRARPGRTGPNGKSQTKSAFLASGMDFWKRFSVHVKLDEAEKAQAAGKQGVNGSAWLSKAQERRGRIKKMIWVFLLLLVILAGGLTAYFLTRPSPAPASIAPSI